MQIKCTAFLLLCLTVQAVAQSTFTPTSPAWSIAVQGGYRVRCGSDNIVRASANTAPSVTLNTYSTARVEQGSAAYTFTGKWAKNTTFMPDLILDSGNNAYIATNGPNQPGVSEVVALKFSSSATNPMLESSATITAPTNHTYTEVAERICSNGDLIILIQDSTSGANYQGIVADVNMAQPNATVTYQYTGSTASVASLTTVPYNSSYPSDTDFYACGYTTSGNTNTNRVWKFHSGGVAPDYSITVGAPGPFQDDYSVSNSYWNYINVDTDDDVLFVTGYVQIKIGQNSTGYYGGKRLRLLDRVAERRQRCGIESTGGTR